MHIQLMVPNVYCLYTIWDILLDMRCAGRGRGAGANVPGGEGETKYIFLF